MEDTELKNIWQDYDRRIEESRILNLQSWAINLRLFQDMQIQKARSRLDSLVRFKIGAVFLGILWTLFLSVLMYGNHLGNLYFTVSVGMIMLITSIAIVVYIKHIILIQEIDYSESITDMQKKLAELQLSTIRIIRMSWLQLPFYTTWFWHRSWIDYGSLKFWMIIFPITLFFILLAIFLYRNITLKNMDRKWVRKLMMAGPEYRSLVQAKKFIAEIEEFKRGLVLN
jgi:hypothetical protein